MDVETTGSFENENEETLMESTAVTGEGEEMEMGLTPATLTGDVDGGERGEETGEDDDDDDGQTSVSRRLGPQVESALEVPSLY